MALACYAFARGEMPVKARQLLEDIVIPALRAASPWDYNVAPAVAYAAAPAFQRARERLQREGQRPMRAIVDYDEALARSWRGKPGSAELLLAAETQFEQLGMTVWLERIAGLRRSRGGLAGRSDAPRGGGAAPVGLGADQPADRRAARAARM